MATICRTYKASESDLILQGDIFKNVSYIYKSYETQEYIDITEFIFPYIIVLSQSCDVSAMIKMINEGGKVQKFMPSILVAPIYEKEQLKKGDHLRGVKENVTYDIEAEQLFNSKVFDIIENDDYIRFHVLNIDNKSLLDYTTPMIDFKHYFSVSPEYLNNIKNNRLCHIEQLNCEQITLRFSNFLARVAFPDSPT